ncbi:hypothetical protein OG233_25885 [Streptomyces sp. NBC_01218]|uniref:hypothetical protein n=1 Tax=unclassified Streptomyces TaxID=2593676 RepID=UPI0023B9C208|nr:MULTISPECIES: hypothetical protein [unclassified Streptomyces]WEH42684.1 hypothetical protein PZB77_26040 [Streptomyces sp. AM 2-1-1]WSQ54307.1 hypothetical protein OG233_25885 [Streptomyces sp. NBC_01218]
MQPSVLPDLAHTDSRAMHWLATAAAVAAAVAVAGLLQPGHATATDSAVTAAAPGGAAAPRVTAGAPDPAGVVFPLVCGNVGQKVGRQARGDLDGDGKPETVAVVHCAAGSGTPPDAVYVLTHGSGAAPRVVATLVDPAMRMTVGELAVEDAVVSATTLGYSSDTVPRCCPDEREETTWRWQGGAFVRSAARPDAGA